MSDGAAGRRPPGTAEHAERAALSRWRPWCLVAAALATLVVLAPPLATLARRADYAEAVQFSFLAVVVPALVALGAPWGLLRLAAAPGPEPDAAFDRLADRRRRHPELVRSVAFIGCDLAVIALWHAPGAVASLSGDGWLSLAETASLLLAGVGLWLELVRSPPLEPRSSHLRRAVLGAVVMWFLWILAYITGLSNHGFYPSFSHVPGGLGAAADQQIASATLWFVAAAALVPVVFWNAIMWLRTEDDPDEELISLLRAERRRASPPLADGGDVPPP